MGLLGGKCVQTKRSRDLNQTQATRHEREACRGCARCASCTRERPRSVLRRAACPARHPIALHTNRCSQALVKVWELHLWHKIPRAWRLARDTGPRQARSTMQSGCRSAVCRPSCVCHAGHNGPVSRAYPRHRPLCRGGCPRRWPSPIPAHRPFQGWDG